MLVSHIQFDAGIRGRDPELLGDDGRTGPAGLAWLLGAHTNGTNISSILEPRCVRVMYLSPRSLRLTSARSFASQHHLANPDPNSAPVQSGLEEASRVSTP